MNTPLSFNKAAFISFSFLFFISSCMSSKKAASVIHQKYAPADLQKDVILLQKILEADHPSLYWYTPKDSMDLYFAQTISSITDSMDGLRFKNKIAWLVSKIRCGHTEAGLSRQYERAIQKIKQPQFPLAIKTWGDSLVVVGSAFQNDTNFRRGTIITSINGMSNRRLLDSMFQFISTDGYSDNFKSQVISFNFAAAYKDAFGLPDRYIIHYLDTSGNEHATVIHNYTPVAAIVKQKPSFPLQKKPLIPQNPFRSLSFDTSHTIAYMRLTTFSGGHLRSFFRKSFAQIRQYKTPNLIIDLRENGGGILRKSVLLTKYLSNQKFRVADTIAARRRHLAYSRYIHPSFEYALRLRFLTHKKADGRFHLSHLETHWFAPKTTGHFSGKIYILQGGYTFSAATLLISKLKGQPNTTIAGEETGGGSYGNSSINLPTIVLPGSHVRVVLPLYRCVFSGARPKTGRGIFPDLPIPPSSDAIRKGIDVKRQKLDTLILKQ